MQKIILKLTEEKIEILNDLRFECFVLSEKLSSGFKKEFAEAARKKNKLTLSEEVSDCLAYDFDGVLLDFSKSEHIGADYQKYAKDLKGKIIGAVTRNRRHEAMLVSECEPDFVVFRAWQDGAEKVKELTSWYNEMFLIQSALLPMEDVDYKSFETDFVILKDEVALKQ